MQGKISMDLSFCQSETSFSLDWQITSLPVSRVKMKPGWEFASGRAFHSIKI